MPFKKSSEKLYWRFDLGNFLQFVANWSFLVSGLGLPWAWLGSDWAGSGLGWAWLGASCRLAASWNLDLGSFAAELQLVDT